MPLCSGRWALWGGALVYGPGTRGPVARLAAPKVELEYSAGAAQRHPPFEIQGLNVDGTSTQQPLPNGTMLPSTVPGLTASGALRAYVVALPAWLETKRDAGRWSSYFVARFRVFCLM